MGFSERFSRKRLVVGGVALLMVAGVATGGAFVTRSSTIFDNVFGTDAAEVVDEGIVVTGDAMSYTFNGTVDGEFTKKIFTVTNKSATKTYKVNVGSFLQPGGVDAGKLVDALDTRVDGQSTGTLSAMTLPAADLLEVAPGASVEVTIEVSVDDATAFQALGLEKASATVDFQFDAIAVP